MLTQKIPTEELYTLVAKEPDKYRFECSTIVLNPIVNVYSVETKQLVTVMQDLSIMLHDGTLNPKYSKEFFTDVNSEMKDGFLKQMAPVLAAEKKREVAQKEAEEKKPEAVDKKEPATPETAVAVGKEVPVGAAK